MPKKILFVHIPKTGGIYLQKLIESNALGASIGHFSLHDICAQNKRALLSRFLHKAEESLGQDSLDEISSLIRTGHKLNGPENNYVVCTAIRNPYAWYKSLYQYFVRRNFGNCICGILARMEWEHFIDLVTSREKISVFNEKHHDFFRPGDLFENMVRDYGSCRLDIGLYSFIVLSLVFVRDVFNYSVDEIADNSEQLTLIDKAYVLKTEQLSADFLNLVGDSENRLHLKNINSSPNRSPDLVTMSSAQRSLIYQQDNLIFKIFDYVEN